MHHQTPEPLIQCITSASGPDHVYMPKCFELYVWLCSCALIHTSQICCCLRVVKQTSRLPILFKVFNAPKGVVWPLNACRQWAFSAADSFCHTMAALWHPVAAAQDPNSMAYAHRYLLPSLKLSFVIKAFPVECFSFCYHGNIGEKVYNRTKNPHSTQLSNWG